MSHPLIMRLIVQQVYGKRRCVRLWAQNNQGVLLELGCPGNEVKFSNAEVYYSLCALVKKKGYDPQYVMATEMPTGGQTGPWKTSLAGKVARELALDGELTIFPHDEGDREPLESSLCMCWTTRVSRSRARRRAARP